MLRHNLLLIYRNFKRFKSTFFINLIGLSTGLACVLLIYLWVKDELSVDKFHEKDSQLFQVMHNNHFPEGIQTYGNTPALLAQTLLNEMPEIEYAVSVNSEYWPGGREGIILKEENLIKARGLFAGKDYFHVFSYKLIQGDKDRVLSDKDGVVISEGLARKIFKKTEDSIGETLEWNHELFKGTFQVSGVFEDPPANSTAQFDVIFNFDVLLDNNPESKEWYTGHADTYLILNKGTDINRFNEKIAGFLKLKNPSNDNSTLFAQQYSTKYLNGQYENGVPIGGRIAYVKLFSIVALFILLIACINFMNLSTAKASQKMKEIGVKKAIGASRKELIYQYMTESMLTAFLSLIIAFLLVILLLPQFNEITGKHLHSIIDTGVISTVVVIAFFTGFVSGCYPAFYLSGFDSVTVLKGKFNTSLGEIGLRKGLIIFQFTLSVIFIVGFLVVNEQINFTQTKNLGYNRDNIISFQLKDFQNKDFDGFLSRLENIPGIVIASSSSGNLLENIHLNSGFSWDGLQEKQPFPSPEVHYDFIETLGMEMKEGRSFSSDFGNERSNIIINETAVEFMGLEDPVGKSIKFHQEDRQIIGVVKDFHKGSIHEKVQPLFFRFATTGKDIVVKVRAGTERLTIEQIEGVYEEFQPMYLFEFTFMDNDYQALYEAENRVAALSKYFTAIAIIISCLGLFGLAAFTAERRTKEIGIRKVMGASEWRIIQLLSSDFARMVLVAIVVALPLSYYLTKNWLDGFTYRIDLEWWYFAGAGLLTMLIALLTVSFQSVKAALMNPVESLRSE